MFYINALTALADPTRRFILDLLLQRPHTVSELATKLYYGQSNISKHLRVLREANLVRVQVDGKNRWYSVNPEPLAELHAWLETYKHLWERGSQS